MDKAYIDENHVVDRYVQGKLDGEDLADFEIYMLDHPDILEEIEYAGGMQKSLVEARSSLFSGAISTPEAARRSRFLFGRKYAMAATVLLAVSVLYSASLYRHNDDLARDIAILGAPTPIAGEFVLETVRSTSNHVIRRSGEAALILRADAGFAISDSYTVDLTGDQSAFSWKRTNLTANSDNFISILVNDIPEDSYRLVIFSEKDQTQSAEHHFDLVQVAE